MMLSTRSFLILAPLALALSSHAVDAVSQVEQRNVVPVDHAETDMSMSEEHQRRQLTWDFFGFLMMMVSGECSDMHLGDHPLCHDCTGIRNNLKACDKLCSMSMTDARKVSYARFCDSSEGSETDVSNSESAVEAYNGNTSPGEIVHGGNFAKGFQWWMAAMAAAVIMAIVAIIMGQRKDNSRTDPERSMMTGAVGRRFTAVAAFANGIFPTKNSGKADVEMAPAAAGASSYHLDGDDATAPADADNMSTASPDQHGLERSYSDQEV
ncbi:hypothetical protein IV203_020687 [Nitzschia inconspicua]|uniref:Transmembrane protein n=1 Tax=Nitzschia inconspicua TaxID=303405 RepID=A0A9K3KFI2_9STRA|nr:hypothetical protein IV203_020687 [Nitzschia inconspicua]